MMKNLRKVALLASLGLAGQLSATEFRAPIATTNGPLYYSFDKLHKKKSNFTMWSVGEARESSEAFIKHGTKTHELSKLFFGKDEFTIGESFQDASAAKWGFTENYNPYLDLTRLAPRVSYQEYGVIWGASWDYPVWKNKGRIGIRASVPFKYIKMERDEEAEDAWLGQQEHVIRRDGRFVKPFIKTDGTTGTVELKNISTYRMNLLKNLLYIDSSGAVYSTLRYNPTQKYMIVGNAAYAKDNTHVFEYGISGEGGAIPFVVIKGKNGEKAPYNWGGALVADRVSGKTSGALGNETCILYPVSSTNNYAVPGTPANNDLIGLTISADPGDGHAGAFLKEIDYYSTAQGNNLWLTTVHGGNSGDAINFGPDTGVDFVEQHLARYHFDVTDWLQDRGFTMRTDEETSFGDITAEVFYEHCFNDSWRGELELGVKFPTGSGGSEYDHDMHDAYRVQMGNGSHWEIKLGGLVAWQALDWMNIKLDAAVNFAIESTEERCAAYKNAHIKNFGPRADAEVSWTSFTGNLDFNFTHPKTKKIKGMIGYQFYYKSEDDVDFKKSTASTWLGKVWSLKADGDAAPVNPGFGETAKLGTAWSTNDLQMELSNSMAEKYTEQFAHRLRMEGAYALSKYIQVAVGGLYTFAGQNIPAEADVHAGCNVRF